MLIFSGLCDKKKKKKREKTYIPEPYRVMLVGALGSIPPQSFTYMNATVGEMSNSFNLKLESTVSVISFRALLNCMGRTL